MLELADTRLEHMGKRLRLVEQTSGQVLLELKGPEVLDAMRAGFLDHENLHFSMFEYATLRRQPTAVMEHGDARFLATIGIRWD